MPQSQSWIQESRFPDWPLQTHSMALGKTLSSLGLRFAVDNSDFGEDAYSWLLRVCLVESLIWKL